MRDGPVTTALAWMARGFLLGFGALFVLGLTLPLFTSLSLKGGLWLGIVLGLFAAAPCSVIGLIGGVRRTYMDLR